MAQDIDPGLATEAVELPQLDQYLAPPPSLREKLSITANMMIHGFGSPEFWNEIAHPIFIDTDEGVSAVRVINRHLLSDPEAPHVAILPPLGTSTAGGHNTDIANYFAENGYVVWMPSALGFEGKVDAGSYRDRSVKTISRYFDQALLGARLEMGLESTPPNIFGASQGGGSGIGIQYRTILRGESPRKIFAETPCSGDNGFTVGKCGKLAVQFTLKEPAAVARHILRQPNPARRAMQLLPTANLRPRAVANTVVSGIGLIFGPDHSKVFADELLNPSHTIVVRYDDDIVASDVYPEDVVVHTPGLHMQVLGMSGRRQADEFFQETEPLIPVS